jgi:hypothetical protein
MFELMKPNWYTVQFCEKNSFLNDKLTDNKYGEWYSVKFTGDAETFLWMTKTEPVVEEKYWGWIEKTSSGKAYKFKWDKQNSPTHLPDGQPTAYTAQKESNNKDITLGMVWKVLIGIQGVPEDETQFVKFFETVKMHADELFLMSENLKNSKSVAESANEAFPDEEN